jgi:hypothetical protein
MNDPDITAGSAKNEAVLPGNDKNPFFNVLRNLSYSAELGIIALIYMNDAAGT